jgi:hypothetical protein
MCEVLWTLLGRTNKLPAGTYHAVIRNVYLDGRKLHVEALLDKAMKETKSEKNKKAKR